MAITQRRNAGYSRPKDRATRWQDLSRESQTDIEGQMRSLGMAKSTVGEERGKLEAVQARPSNSPKTRRKAGQRITSLEALQPHLKDEPITLRKAANSRVSLVKAGMQRTATEGTSHNQDWFFQHHKKLADVAADTGHDRYRVIGASAVMSPQNNPEQELSAVT